MRMYVTKISGVQEGTISCIKTSCNPLAFLIKLKTRKSKDRQCQINTEDEIILQVMEVYTTAPIQGKLQCVLMQ